MAMRRFGTLLVGAGFAAACAAAAAAQTDRAAASAEPLALAARGLALEAPSTRVYRSVGADGSVAFGDQPQAGAKVVQIRTFSSGSDREALATAKLQRDYWREQDNAFARRQEQRERDEQQARAQRERAAAGPLVLLVPHHLRAPAYAGMQPRVPVGGASPVYASSPGAAAGAPAAFIGSGFSSAR